ncbi:hypothetical protein BpHYR1_023232 [Brachionus plicatilis]|uniref:Uncharacterized protein n=1 Tax=Brachionus plicatilis TaxID=10195 RepID=A0A3M7SSM8_BRAPC|nr:hypothetical protein BpHYR1_023232 [Brachionus plicatilis]
MKNSLFNGITLASRGYCLEFLLKKHFFSNCSFGKFGKNLTSSCISRKNNLFPKQLRDILCLWKIKLF